MNLAKHRATAGFTLFLLCTIQLQIGCMAVSALKGKQGLNVNAVKAGISKAEVEEILGTPVREWLTPSGIRYCIYTYDAGVPPSTGDAAAHVFMDIATVFVWELFGALDQLPEFRVNDQMAVSYDASDAVVGVFDHFGDFDELPPDGHARE